MRAISRRLRHWHRPHAPYGAEHRRVSGMKHGPCRGRGRWRWAAARCSGGPAARALRMGRLDWNCKAGSPSLAMHPGRRGAPGWKRALGPRSAGAARGAAGRQLAAHPHAAHGSGGSVASRDAKPERSRPNARSVQDARAHCSGLEKCPSFRPFGCSQLSGNIVEAVPTYEAEVLLIGTCP